MSKKNRQTVPESLEDKHPGDHFDLTNENSLLIRSHYGLVYLETKEEERAGSLLMHVADDLDLPFFIWTPSKGLQRADFGETIYK
jgi:hypothetical protein